MATIEERLANLEKAVFNGSKPTPPKDWRLTVGRFKDDPVMSEIIDHALQAREQERQQANVKKSGDKE